jgi:hypothetical protein
MADINSMREMFFLKGMNKSEIARETGRIFYTCFNY